MIAKISTSLLVRLETAHSFLSPANYLFKCVTTHVSRLGSANVEREHEMCAKILWAKHGSTAHFVMSAAHFLTVKLPNSTHFTAGRAKTLTALPLFLEEYGVPWTFLHGELGKDSPVGMFLERGAKRENAETFLKNSTAELAAVNFSNVLGSKKPGTNNWSFLSYMFSFLHISAFLLLKVISLKIDLEMWWQKQRWYGRYLVK